jgi:hypothetical protein
MRLALVPPSKLTSEQLPLYEDMKVGISVKYGAFTTMRDDGTILGPWSAWLHDPKLGTAIWNVTTAMTRFRHLPEVSRQIVILVVGTRFRAAGAIGLPQPSVDIGFDQWDFDLTAAMIGAAALQLLRVVTATTAFSSVGPDVNIVRNRSASHARLRTLS